MCDFDTFDNVIELDYPFKYLDNDYKKDSHHKGVYEWGSCRGLFCFTTGYCHPYTIFLYNPTTRTHKTLPFLAIELPFHADRMNFLGFGYDSVSDDYKCVRILQHDHDDDDYDYKCVRILCHCDDEDEEEEEVDNFCPSQVMVYSLRADSWRQGAQDIPYYFRCHCEYYIDFKGILDWSAEDDNRRLLPIVAFNLSDETFSSVSLPDYETETFTFAHIGVLDDCLCLTLNDVSHCDVWVMKEYGLLTSWTKLFRFAKEQSSFYLSPISFINSRKQLLLSYHSFKVCTVDLETVRITEVMLPGYRRIWNAYVCSENLLMFKDVENGLGGTRKVRTKNAKHRRLMRLA